MKDIAAEAGVSKGLVSLILSGMPGPSADSAARVLAIADRLGYRADRAASLLARRRSRLLGVTMTPSSPFHGQLVEQIQRMADQHGYEVALGAVSPSHGERRAIEGLLDLRCEALLLLGSDLSRTALRALTASVPTVSVGRPVTLAGVDVVRADDRLGIGLAVGHLVGLGHRSIAHIDGGATSVARERRAGYTAAMSRHGLPAVVVPGGPTEGDGYAALHRLRAEYPQTTAVVGYNDRSAVGAMEYMDYFRLGVPDLLSVTGFDNSTLAERSRIDLTTVSQEATEQAELAVEAVVQRLDGGRTARTEHVLAPTLIVRSTTGPPGIKG